MKTTVAEPAPAKGTSLIEAIIAVGVLAVAVPLVFGTMAETGETSLSSQAETRSSWIIPACVEELRLAMNHQSTLLDELKPGEAFPNGGVLAIAFSGEGKAVKKIAGNDYTKGVRLIGNEPVRFIASMSGEPSKSNPDGTQPNLQVKIVLEYPAAARMEKRQKIEFYTCMP